MSSHKTPSKVTVEFADGTSKVFDNVSTPTNNAVKFVLEINAYLADSDSGTSSTYDQRFTGVLYTHPYS